MMAEVPLARHPGRVALLLQHLGERRLPVRDAVPGLRAERPVDADAVGIAAGQERRPRGRADRLGDVEVGEPPPLAREPVEVRRGEPGGAEAADVGVSLVVGEDDDDVRRPRRRVERGRREQRGEQGEGPESKVSSTVVIHVDVGWPTVIERGRCDPYLLPAGEGGRDGRMRVPGPHMSHVLRRDGRSQRPKTPHPPLRAPSPGGEGKSNPGSAPGRLFHGHAASRASITRPEPRANHPPGGMSRPRGHRPERELSP